MCTSKIPFSLFVQALALTSIAYSSLSPGSLERVPETGRLRFIDVSESQESAMGLQATQETLAQYSSALLSPLHPTSKRVREVARRVVESNGLGKMKDAGLMTSLPKISIWGGGEEDGWFGGNGSAGEGSEATLSRGGEKRKDIEWEVYVIKDDATKNAFVLPGTHPFPPLSAPPTRRLCMLTSSCTMAGGKIFVFTGILPVCKNDDGLASVLGHEVAHQVARHSAERMSSLKVLFVLGYVLEALGLDVGFSRLLLTFLLQLPNSRKAESEADHIGIHLMARACFDPRESSRMWTRMSESEKTSGMGGGAASVDFMSTHPANAKRIKALEKWMPEALDIRAASPCGDTTSQFEAFREHLPLGQTGRVWG
ncbi:hypothetical protein QFC21_000754 [Naganishia friedmannii]|uniref:Uncharacterized protein n=1 Tax=Naganishia friedmannii TaxID=89922 RepID=A0ACC2W6D3_9TREE|nr:hypothetical protein QFC21_000754 [Naganishia friedmannii]